MDSYIGLHYILGTGLFFLFLPSCHFKKNKYIKRQIYILDFIKIKGPQRYFETLQSARNRASIYYMDLAFIFGRGVVCCHMVIGIQEI
jgi:hypothetical protein